MAQLLYVAARRPLVELAISTYEGAPEVKCHSHDLLYEGLAADYTVTEPSLERSARSTKGPPGSSAPHAGVPQVHHTRGAKGHGRET
jgi:hypothetical protein